MADYKDLCIAELEDRACALEARVTAAEENFAIHQQMTSVLLTRIHKAIAVINRLRASNATFLGIERELRDIAAPIPWYPDPETPVPGAEHMVKADEITWK